MNLLTCRPGFEQALKDELNSRVAQALASCPLPGVVLAKGSLPSDPLVFEHARLNDARHLQPAALKPVSEDTAAELLDPVAAPSEESVQVVSWGPDPDGKLSRRAEGFRKALLRLCPQAEGQGTARFLRAIYTRDGLYYGFGQDALPGPGTFRMKQDPAAPSRSYLKLEEVFARGMKRPAKNSTAVDLGAAPGGWTFSLLKCGCRVTAVDHGPLKLVKPLPGGSVEHLRADGLTFKPRRIPVDWLVADMLIPPGKALGLLKRWLGGGWAQHFVVNIKLPQQHPWRGLEPVFDYLSKQRDYTFTMRQLYHDRREVTVWGRKAG